MQFEVFALEQVERLQNIILKLVMIFRSISKVVLELVIFN